MRVRSLLPNVLLGVLLAQAAPGVGRAADPAPPGRAAEAERERQEMEQQLLAQIDLVRDEVHASIQRLLDERLARITTTQCIAIAGAGGDCVAPTREVPAAPARVKGM